METLWNLTRSGENTLVQVMNSLWPQSEPYWVYRELLTVIMEKQELHEFSAPHLYQGGSHHQAHSHQRRAVAGPMCGFAVLEGEIFSPALKLLFHKALGTPIFIHEENRENNNTLSFRIFVF